MKQLKDNIKRTAVIFFLLAIFGFAAAQDNRMVNAGASAKHVVNQYLTALVQGDTNTVVGLLGGNFLQNRKRLLSNPTYPTRLQEIYSNVTYSIIGHQVLNISMVTVDVNIVWSDSKEEKYRFLLKREGKGVFKIHAEDVL